MNETWKTAKGFEGLYECSDMGEVRSIRNITNTHYGKVLKQQKNKKGYMQLLLRKNGKYVPVYVHRLIISSFCGETNKTVNHKNGDKTDNRLSNLEYMTMAENLRHATKVLNVRRGENHWNAKLKTNDIIEIKKLLSAGHTQTSIAASFLVSRVTITDIASGKNWSYII